MKLNQEEKESLNYILDSDGFQVLLKVMSILAQSEGNQLLNLDSKSTDDRTFLINKARSEGALKLYSTFLTFCQKQRKNQ